MLVRNDQMKPECFDQTFPPTFGFRVDPEVKKKGILFPLVSLVSIFKSCGVAECVFRRAHRHLNWHFVACIRMWDPSEARNRLSRYGSTIGTSAFLSTLFSRDPSEITDSQA